MKFKVAYNAKLDMFGKLKFAHTLIGDDDSASYRIERFLDDVVFLNIKDKYKRDIEKNKLINELKTLAVGEEKIIINKKDKSAILIERVDESINMGDLIDELYEDIK